MREPFFGRPITPPRFPAEAAHLAAEYSSDLIFLLDSAGVVLTANPAALATLGFSADQLIGKLWVELLDAGSRAKGSALLREAATRPTEVYELNQLVADQAVVMIGYRAIPVLPELNARAGTILLADTPVALPSEPAGALPWQATFYVAAQHGLTPALADRLREWPALLPEHFMGDQAFVIEASDPALGAQRIDMLASARPLLMLMAVPIRNGRQLLGWLCVITDRYQTFGHDLLELVGSIGALLGPSIENARLHTVLLETSGQLSAVLDSIDSGVLLLDSAGVIRYANKRLGELLETDVGAWPGQACAEQLGPLIAPLAEPTRLFEGSLWVSTGTQRRVLRCFTNRIDAGASANAGVIEVYTDVTEIHQIDRLKDEFIAAAAHDLKTPVTAVKGYSQIALRLAQRLNDQRFIAPLEMINARSNDLAYLMDTLLDMSRIQAGRLRLDLEQVAVQDLVVRAARHFTLDTQRQRRAIDLDLPDELITVCWDAPRIERLLINLIGNALKYSPDGGQIMLRARSSARHNAIELTVTDHGIGIPADEREQIFERFYRARQAVADGFKGSGFGLYICRSVVAAHQGQIWAGAALHGGRGTTIFVLLPRVVDPGELEEQ